MPDPKSSPQTSRRDWGVYALIVFTTFLAYAPALRGGLLWDDAGHLTRPDLRSIQGLWRIWTDPTATQQYYPLLHSAFWVEHAAWGDSVIWYHLLNVALHALSACLVVKIVRRLELRGAWLAGLLFALHPLCVEAVAWMSEQKSTLSGVFYFASALVYLKFDESRRRSTYVAALALFVAALLSKTVTATLPGALLVVLWWRRGRIDWKCDVVPLAPWVALGTASGLFTRWVESALIGAHGAEFALSTGQRILLAGRVIWFYAGRVVWPAGLTFFYPRWDVEASQSWQWVFPVGLIASAAALWVLARRTRGSLAAFLYFCGTLFPVLGFVNIYPFRYSFVADHFAYLATLGILVPVAVVLSRFRAAAVIPAVLAFLTWQQAAIYRDEETLYRVTLERNPAAFLAHTNLGNLLLERNRAEAMQHLEGALRLKPDFPEAHLSMGNALLDVPGRLNDAVSEYRIAVRLAPSSERAHTNLGNALLRTGQVEEAVAQLQEALRIDPSNVEAHNDLGNAFSGTGRLDDAAAQYRLALRYDPNFAEAHNNLGRCYAQAGKLADAIAEFQAALRAKPDSFSAHSNLGNAWSLVPGRLEDAIAEYRAALAIRPNFATAHNNLGYALSQKGAIPEAIVEYREAIRLDPNAVDAHFNLGVALARSAATRAEALAEFEAVQRLKPNARTQQIIQELRR